MSAQCTPHTSVALFEGYRHWVIGHSRHTCHICGFYIKFGYKCIMPIHGCALYHIPLTKEFPLKRSTGANLARTITANYGSCCGRRPFCCYLTRLPLPLILCSLFATAKINWQLRGQQFLLGNQFSLTMQPDRCERLLGFND